jgi:hypothetical protein
LNQGAWNESKIAPPIPARKPESAAGERASGRGASHPYEDAVSCLRESAVPFALVQVDVELLHTLPQLDVLIDARETKIAFAALRRAGFREMGVRDVAQASRSFLRWEHDRFFVLVVHTAFAENGLRYMGAALALERADRRGPVPVLSREDRFLHLLLHPLLGSRDTVQPVQLLRLRREGLAVERLAAQTEGFGIESPVRQALRDLDALLQNERRWYQVRARLSWALLRHPGNLSALLGHLRTEYLRFSFRPVVMAVVGPQRAGKTEFAAALQDLLAGSPFDPALASMGCWNSSLLSRVLQPLVPGDICWSRVLQARRGKRIKLSGPEQQLLETTQPRIGALGLRTAVAAVRNTLFHALIGAAMVLRYVRCIARSRRPVVIADGWVYDLELRAGREAYTHGERMRRLIFRCFPQPDGFLYLSTPFETVAARDRRQDHDAFTSAGRALRRRLGPNGALELVAEGSPRDMARIFLSRYWAHLLERHNRHVAPAESDS